MIIQPTIKEEVKTIHSNKPYFFCAYDSKNKILKFEENSVVGFTSTTSNIFGADTLEEVKREIKRLKLK